ncbi:hypothetical protein B0H65DRAFT_445074 [Neurospora tetraspora]|uniref:Uncharacterized protein n=1 Tax=Neurospora tetraspora TaxID=94610 RepID=A0AAE0J828_9PEZI|nr:hypothetical protein B0H65DRAFT_445074 [Neurospora tetraspora]
MAHNQRKVDKKDTNFNQATQLRDLKALVPENDNMANPAAIVPAAGQGQAAPAADPVGPHNLAAPGPSWVAIRDVALPNAGPAEPAQPNVRPPARCSGRARPPARDSARARRPSSRPAVLPPNAADDPAPSTASLGRS